MSPAYALRNFVSQRLPPGMLRWDRDGRALLVSDAPRRMGGDALHLFADCADITATRCGNLLRIDLSPAAYTRLLKPRPVCTGPWDDRWFDAQALIAALLRQNGEAADADIPLLRAALLATAQGDTAIRAFLPKLRERDAVALWAGGQGATWPGKPPENVGHREISAEIPSIHACASICAQWLWTAHGIGIPPVYEAVWPPYDGSLCDACP